jgi:hypothetical protein
VKLPEGAAINVNDPRFKALQGFARPPMSSCTRSPVATPDRSPLRLP